MKALDRVKQAHIAIMRHKKFCAFSGVLACGKVSVDPQCPSAATNGWDVVYGKAFVDALNDQQLRLLVLHEAMHKAYQHLMVWRNLYDKNPQLANLAADHFVNLTLMDTDANEGFLQMPSVGVQPEAKYRGWSVKQIFDDLMKNPPPQKKGGGQGQGDGQQGLDTHDWDGAGKTPADEQVKQGEEIQRAMRQGEMLAKKIGKGSGDATGVFGDLLTPKVNWRQVLRDFITEYCSGRDESSWRKPNRRYLADDIYMPSLVGETLAELVVVFDTSGSCFGSDEMTRFVSELGTVISTVKPNKCHVLYTDTRVAGHQTFEDGQFAVQDLKVKGGGGTHLPVAFDYCAEKRIVPTACVVLSDMYTDFGSPPPYPVLWASTTNKKAPWGTNINIAD